MNINFLKESTKKVPVTIQKGADAGEVKKIQPLGIARTSDNSGEKSVELREVEDGVYDLIFQCSCGEKTVIRLESLEQSKGEEPVASADPVESSTDAAPQEQALPKEE